MKKSRPSPGDDYQRPAHLEEECEWPGKRSLTETLPVQRKGDGPIRAPEQADPAGSPLADDIRTRMERSFAADFSSVRVHEGGEAEALGAQAFTRGESIHFAPGRYDASTAAGQNLIAHELAHVVQQRAGRARTDHAFGGVFVNSDPVLEGEADGAAERAVLDRPAGIDAGAGGRGEDRSIQARIEIQGVPQFNQLAALKQWLAQQQVQQAQQAIQQAVAGNALDQLLTDMLNAGFVYRYSNADTFLTWLAANQNNNHAQVQPVTAAAAGQALAQLKSFMFADEVPNVVVYLQGGVARRVVICATHNAQVEDYYSGAYAAVANQIIVCSDAPIDVAVEWLSARHGIAITDVNGAPGWANVAGQLQAQRPVIVQNPQERGDMHDVKIALQLEQNLKVIFALGDHRRRAEGEDILGYYTGANAGRVRVAREDGRTIGGVINNRQKRGVSNSTEIIAQSALNNRGATDVAILTETTGLPVQYPPVPQQQQGQQQPNPLHVAIHAVLQAYDQDLQNVGHFQNGVPYMIVLYRDSGHNVAPPRQPSHPELDTGTDGFLDLMAAVVRAGFVPVPMGMPPNHGNYQNGPNLIQYWSWASCTAPIPNRPQNQRQAEYGLLRRLKEQYNVRALAMRSGGTDALVFAGIETISIDFATETYDTNDLQGTGLDPSTGSAASWRRAAKREVIKPGMFHQGFMTEARQDNVLPAQGAQWTGAIDTNALVHGPPQQQQGQQGQGQQGQGQQGQGQQQPGLSPNAQRMDALIAQFFGQGQALPRHRSFDMDAQNPFTNLAGGAADVRHAHEDAKTADWQQRVGQQNNALNWFTQQANRLRGGNGQPPAALAAAQRAVNDAGAAAARAQTLVQNVAQQIQGINQQLQQAQQQLLQAQQQLQLQPQDQQLQQQMQQLQQQVAQLQAQLPVPQAVHARAQAYLQNLQAVGAPAQQYIVDIGNLSNIPQQGQQPNQQFHNALGTQLARLEAVKEAVDFLVGGIKLIDQRITVDQGIRQGNIVL